MKVKNILRYSFNALSISVAMYGSGALAATGYATLNGGTSGGAGGNVIYASTGTQIHQALCNRASSDTPVIIYVEGTINHGNTSKVSGDSCNTADGVIELKEISNVSIIGTGSGALFDELGIHIRKSSNIILQNLHVRNVKKSGSPTSNGGDAIGMESDVHHVWVDHVTLEAQGGENDGYDALFDMKATTKYVTLSYSILRNSGRGGLVGSSDSDDDNGPVTYHHNYYQNIDSRMPLLRHATAHSYNNYFNGISKSGMNPRIGGQIKAENNYFENAKDPIGTFYTNDMGYWDVSGNVFGSGVLWSSDGDKNHPAGPNPSSTTSISPGYSYSIDDASCVRAIVLATAGAGTGLSVSDGSCTTTTPDPVDPDPVDPDPVDPDPVDPNPSTGNLSLNAGSDGSSKASGSSYGNVRDGDTSSYWSPSGSTGTISIKNLNAEINTVNIVETSGAAGNITAWSLVNHDTGNTLATGSSAGWITFDAVTLSKVSFVIESSSGTPQIAEFETYYSNDTDTTPEPSGAVAMSTSLSGSDVTLNWSVSNVDTVADQQLYRDTDADPAGRVRIASGLSGNSFIDYGLADGAYYYWLKVIDGNDQLINSNAASATVVSAGISDLLIEENGAGFCAIDGAIESAHSGYTGIGYSNTSNESGAGIDYAVNVAVAGDYQIVVRYANGADARPGGLLINDTLVANIPFASTGSWTSYANENVVTVSLSAGNNLVRIQSTNGAGLANIDSLTVTGIAPNSGNCDGTVVPNPNPNPNVPNGDCQDLLNNANINWRESSLQTDQEIVACLSQSLGNAVGFGENAKGGYDANGGSQLTVITTGSSVSVEQQLFDAMSSEDHNWIVFDKDDFANEVEVAMYRLQCGDPAVQSNLGISSSSSCIDYQQWCSDNGVSSSECAVEFFNDRLNDKDLPIRNTVIGSNTTIDGRGAKPIIRFNGFAIGKDSSGQPTQTANSVIVTNLTFRGAGHTEDHELDPDMIRTTGASHDVWIHKNTFELTGDSAFDVKVGAFDITMSFNKLYDVKRAALHGSSDSRTINENITTTMHHNAFVTRDNKYTDFGNTLRRVPLLRRGVSHITNNVFVGYRKKIFSIRKGGYLQFNDNVVMNDIDFQEKDSMSDSLSEIKGNLSEIKEGSLDSSGSVLWFYDNCQLLGNSETSLDSLSSGSSEDLEARYSSSSRDMINNNFMSAGQSLADYILATAGVEGEIPFNSPYAPSSVSSQGCQ